LSSLRVGETVEVEGVPQSSGTVLARKIKVEDNDNDKDEDEDHDGGDDDDS
jgi:hypothetical protein